MTGGGATAIGATGIETGAGANTGGGEAYTAFGAAGWTAGGGGVYTTGGCTTGAGAGIIRLGCTASGVIVRWTGCGCAGNPFGAGDVTTRLGCTANGWGARGTALGDAAAAGTTRGCTGTAEAG